MTTDATSITSAHGRTIVSYGLPIIALAVAIAFHISGLSVDEGMMSVRVLVGAISSAIMFVTVFVVLHHAEAVASRLGEPYGTLVLTMAVTAIEVSIIVSMMLHGANNPTLARESVFSTVMITSTGVVGLCLTLGGWRASQAGDPAARHECLSSGSYRTDRPDTHSTDLYGCYRPGHLFDRATRFCEHTVGAALCRFCFCPDSSSSRRFRGPTIKAHGR